MDADLALVDLSRSVQLQPEHLMQTAPLSNPYLGSTFRGAVVRTIRRGRDDLSIRPNRRADPAADSSGLTYATFRTNPQRSSSRPYSSDARHVRPGAAAGNAKRQPRSFTPRRRAARDSRNIRRNSRRVDRLGRLRCSDSLYVLEGELESQRRSPESRRLCICSGQSTLQSFRPRAAARAAIIEKPYQSLPGIAAPAVLQRPRKRQSPPAPLMGDDALEVRAASS